MYTYICNMYTANTPLKYFIFAFPFIYSFLLLNFAECLCAYLFEIIIPGESFRITESAFLNIKKTLFFQPSFAGLLLFFLTFFGKKERKKNLPDVFVAYA